MHNSANTDATAEARGSPLSPKGYTAEGDVKLRGIDALPALIDDAPSRPTCRC